MLPLLRPVSHEAPTAISPRECRQLMLRRVMSELPQLLPIEGDIPFALVPGSEMTGPLPSSSEESVSRDASPERVKDRERESNPSLSLGSVPDESLQLPAWLEDSPGQARGATSQRLPDGPRSEGLQRW
ncbi:unnamed protein product [Durusdinium trenchii]|uniref:Uncharacterized protein n=1 Tax=Durusdinium trenchii TaxID=1381693 RepID=A0ABP0P246_9DINO